MFQSLILVGSGLLAWPIASRCRIARVWYTANVLAPQTGEPRGTVRQGRSRLDALALAQRIVDIAADRQASDILLLDLRAVSPIADYFVICSGNSERQLEALEHAIVGQLRDQEHVRPRQREGSAASGWVLLDSGDGVVHIFRARAREFYRLEELWSAAPTVVRVP